MNKENNQPPHFFVKLLKWFCRPAYHPDIEGDLLEQFNERVERQGLNRAKYLFKKDVLKLFRPGIIRSISLTQKLNYLGMIQHTLLLAFRNFKKYKSSFFINLTGLSTGLACTLLIYLWVSDELAVDQFHENDANLYQVMENRVQSHGIWTAESNSPPLADDWRADFPEIQYIAAATRASDATVSVDNINLRSRFKHVGPDFFNIFSFELTQGAKNQVLADKSSIVISQDLSEKLFHTTDNVVGRMVKIDHDKEYMVSGVFETIPKSANQQFDFVLSTEVIKTEWAYAWHWNNTWIRTFLVLKPDAHAASFNSKVVDYVKQKTNDEISHRTPFIAKYSDRYLYGKYENGVVTGGRIEYVKLFSIIAFFILFIACINFTNLSTARASRRIKEVGIKKAVGAGRKVLAFQYLGESMLMATLSLIVAVLLVVIVLPQFNVLTGKELTLMLDIKMILSLLSVTLITGVVAGSYPALYLSGFSPVIVLKGKLNTSVGELWARKGLVVFQFVLTIVLISSVLVIYKQVEMVQSKNIGYDKDQVLMFRREGKLYSKDHLETFLAEVRNIPGIVNASSTSHGMTGHFSGTYGVQWDGRDPNDRTEFENVTVNYGLMETLGIEMKEGRTFSRSFGSDTSKIIFSEEAVRYMNLEDPVGKTIKLWGEDRQIIGVSKDFHFQSLHTQVKPLFFRLDPEDNHIFMVKIGAGQTSDVVTRLSDFYEAYNPGFPFEYNFLDDTYQELYGAEQRVASLSKYFAGLAILISCLGLFGLAAFTAERRTKEIGIRKILGSSVLGIIYMLSTDFTKMVLAAIIIAIPLSYLAAKNWLDGFAYRIELEWWFFGISGLTALLIAWFIVGWQTLKVARVNPSECLRNE